MKSIPRLKTDFLISLLKEDNPHPNVILVEGPRQAGKTTVVFQALEKSGLPYCHLNLEKDLRHRAAIDRCEDFRDFEQWLADTVAFRPGSGTALFIDEAQESRQLGRFVRAMKEEWTHTPVILTGSMMSRLFRDDVRYPVGRVTPVHIQTFSFFEYLKAQGKEEWLSVLTSGTLDAISPSRHEALLAAFNHYLHLGGLPEVIRADLDGKDSAARRLEIYEAYRHDFMRVFGEDQGFLFERALRAVADHVGSPSKFSQAVPANDAAYKKIAATFSRLDAWHLMYTSEQRSTTPERGNSLHPKRYLFDLGLLSHLRTLGTPNLDILKTLEASQRHALGGIFENVVAFVLTYLAVPLSGWKKSPTGTEIDFIARMGDLTCPIECKAALRLKEPHLAGLKAYMTEYHLPLGVTVNAAPFSKRPYPFGTILSVPIYAVEAVPVLISKS